MNYREDTLTDIMINDRDNNLESQGCEKKSYVNPAANQSPVTAANINITNNIANTTSRPATLPISSPFGPPTDSNLSTMVKSSTTGDLNSTGLVASLAPNKGTPIDAFKEWSLSTFKCGKQLINERLGKTQRTVDANLENEIERLKDSQRRYQQILKSTNDMVNTYSNLVIQQKLLFESFNNLAMKENKQAASDQQQMSNGNSNGGSDSPTLNLTCDFKQNAAMLKNLSKNGEKLIMALKFFCSNLHTLVHKTIEDTMITIRSYESARLEYDAEKNSVSNLLPAQAVNANTEKLISTKARYEKLKEDVAIKLQFLDENKTKEMRAPLKAHLNSLA